MYTIITKANTSSIWAGSPQPDDGWQPPQNWFGNIQYLINISLLGAFCCVLLFLVVKLKSDHQLPGPASLAAKLLSVWHATGQQVARLCGANASQYLAAEGYSFVGFFAISVIALIVILPLNLYGGTVPLQDQFSRSTVIHISKGSPLLWWHYVFMLIVVGVMHLCIQALSSNLSTTWLDGEASGDFVTAFSLMIHGVPRSLSANKRPLQEYFEHRYPGKVYRVIVPPDLSTFYCMKKNFLRKRKRLAYLLAREQSRVFTLDEEEELLADYKDGVSSFVDLAGVRRSRFPVLRQGLRMCKSVLRQVWVRLLTCSGCAEEDAIAKLQYKCDELERELMPYKDGTARGAGIAFVIFKDLHTASRALQDIRTWTRAGMTTMIEGELGRSRWKAERAPPARDIYWHHLGSRTLSRVFRRVTVNTFLLMLLFFCSSPVAAFTALHNVGRLINPDAMDHVKVWLSWVQSSSWAAAFIIQFLPNVLMFVSMYFIIPTVLTYLSSFESHLTLSGEQRAALVKTVLFFLVNLIFLRGLLETSLEAALLHMRRCYEEGTECKQIEQYMSSSFLANSCLSSTAFLITSAFLGISYDLLSPIPWIKRKIQQLKGQQMETDSRQGAYAPIDYNSMIREETLHEELLTETGSPNQGARTGAESSLGFDVEGQDLSGCPLARDVKRQKAVFDYAQYYAFNLTIFALALIYSSFVPIIVPIAAFYFGYRYIVDKYNFLFMYRARGIAVTNDGKLLSTVLRVMKICIVLYLFAMLYFFYVRGDKEKLQFLCTLALAVLVCAKYSIEKLLCPPKDGFDVMAFESLGSIDSSVNGVVEYEVFSKPNIDWDTPVAGDM